MEPGDAEDGVVEAVMFEAAQPLLRGLQTVPLVTSECL
jgi:hypothetical protein